MNEENNDSFYPNYNYIKIYDDDGLNNNKELLNKLKYKDNQIEGLKIFIHKLTEEKVNLLMNEKKHGRPKIKKINQKENFKINNQDISYIKLNNE